MHRNTTPSPGETTNSKCVPGLEKSFQNLNPRNIAMLHIQSREFDPA